LNQADGVHPNNAGERIVAENVWKALRPILDSLARR
jgi:acyl-CoA thioesterase-1